MSDYELYHAERKHKYIKKIGNRYFYTQNELNAYLGGKKTSLGIKELDTVINRDQEAFYAKNSQDSNRALRQGREAQKKYDKTILGKADKATNGLATAPYRILRNKARSRAEEKSREAQEKKAEEHRVAVENVNAAQERGKNRTAYRRTRKAITMDQNRGRARTAQLSGRTKGSSAYDTEVANESKRRRKKAVSTVSNASKKSIKSLSKSASKGKQALKKFYKTNINPGVTATYDEAVIK